MKTPTIITLLTAAALNVAQTEDAGGPSESVAMQVHEWGTFTVLQGSDGRPIEWYQAPSEIVDLPPHRPHVDRRVHEPGRPDDQLRHPVPGALDPNDAGIWPIGMTRPSLSQGMLPKTLGRHPRRCVTAHAP